MERESIQIYIKRVIAQAGIVGKLIAASTVVFLLFLAIQLIEKLFALPGLTETIRYYFAAPGNPAELIYKPWSIITHLFTHGGFLHFLFNMIMLYFSAQIFTHFFQNQRRLLATYFLGGIFAYLVHVLAYFVFPGLAGGTPPIIGASASVMAIFVASAVFQPSFKVHLFGVFQIPLFLLAALYILSDLLGIGSEDRVAHFAHLGGAAFGALSVIKAHSPSNIMNRFDRFIFKLKLNNISFKRKPKMKVHQSDNVKNMTDDQYNENKKVRQDRIDAILDKISKKGYEGLTKEEKDILFNESKRK